MTTKYHCLKTRRLPQLMYRHAYTSTRPRALKQRPKRHVCLYFHRLNYWFIVRKPFCSRQTSYCNVGNVTAVVSYLCFTIEKHADNTMYVFRRRPSPPAPCARPPSVLRGAGRGYPFFVGVSAAHNIVVVKILRRLKFNFFFVLRRGRLFPTGT